MDIGDKKDLQSRLLFFSNGDEEYMEITRIEAKYLGDLVNDDWRRWNQMTNETRILARIKVSEYEYEGKKGFLAEIKQGRYTTTFNENTLKKLFNGLGKRIYWDDALCVM